MLNRLDLRGSVPEDLLRRLPRPPAQTEPPIEQVRAVVDEVRRDGDRALQRYEGLPAHAESVRIRTEGV
jgi:histidinol dehydrogenase